MVLKVGDHTGRVHVIKRARSVGVLENLERGVRATRKLRLFRQPVQWETLLRPECGKPSRILSCSKGKDPVPASGPCTRQHQRSTIGEAYQKSQRGQFSKKQTNNNNTTKISMGL